MNHCIDCQWCRDNSGTPLCTAPENALPTETNPVTGLRVYRVEMDDDETVAYTTRPEPNCYWVRQPDTDCEHFAAKEPNWFRPIRAELAARGAARARWAG